MNPLHKLLRSKPRQLSIGQRRRRRRLQLFEQLEDRRLLATVSFELVGPTPTTANEVSFLATFSEPVNSVTVDDFAPALGVGVQGTVSSVTPSGGNYEVTVSGLTGDGSLGLDLVPGNDISTVAGGMSVDLLETVDEFYVLDSGGAPNQTNTPALGTQPIDIAQPYLGLNYIIALQGVFPSNGAVEGDPEAIAGGDPFIGEVELFGGSFAPRGWAFANGQLLSISSYSALFSILGTTYGGDGRVTFGLPDLRGRVPIGEGQGPGLPYYSLGQKVGAETVTLNSSNLPQHAHQVDGDPTGSAGGSQQPFSNVQPSLVMNYLIATVGTFPSFSPTEDGPELSGSDPFLGEVVMFAGNFAPGGWAFADGQLLSISSNTALFSILGTTYGGDGETTFALPDLRGRTAIHAGGGPGLPQQRLGQRSGSLTTTLSNSNIGHQHQGPSTTSFGSTQSVSNMQPSLALNYLVVTQGNYPSSNAANEGAEETDGPELIGGDEYLGAIGMFAGNFAPSGSTLANGQLLPISSYTALFSLYGATYGGDGETTFGMPELRGRAALHTGSSTGPGLSPHHLGQRGGAASSVLSQSQIPAHEHSVGSIVRQVPGSQETAADSLVFRVNFTEEVKNVVAADFAVNSTSTAVVSSVAVVDPRTYDVTVSGGDLAGFTGSVGLDFAGAQNIQDLAGNALPSGEPPVDETYDHVAPQGAQIIDDTDAEYSQTGNWTVVGRNGHDGGFRFSAAGTGDSTATWTFAVTPGRYSVSATWRAWTNRATNAPFSIGDGVNAPVVVSVNQMNAPVGTVDEGTTFQDLVTIDVFTNELVVQASNQADGLVIADAIRAERIGDPVVGPEIAVSNGGNIADGTGVLDFGAVPPGSTAVHTVTITNVGTTDLTLGTLTLPPGFTAPAGFGATVLAASASTTLDIHMDTSVLGPRNGEVVIANNDSDENPFNFMVQGNVADGSAMSIVDDEDPGFELVGNWTEVNRNGNDGDFQYSLAGDGSNTATWRFAVQPGGTYRVSASWRAWTNRATDAPFTVLDGVTPLSTINVNQQLIADDRLDGGTWFEDLGSFTITGNQLVIQLSNDANGLVVADAIRIEQLP